MNTMRRSLIAIQMQDDMFRLINDLEIVRNEISVAEEAGRVDDMYLLSNRDGQICAELDLLSYHLSRSTPTA